MSNVLVEKNKLDILANAISDKSGEPLTFTLDEMVEAVDGIKTEANLQEKQYSVNKAGQELIQADSGYDGLSNVLVNVPTGSATGPTSEYATNLYGFNYVSSTNKSLIVYGYYIPTTPTVTAGYVDSSVSSTRNVRINTSDVYNPDITVSNNTVTVPRGYYPADSVINVSGGGTSNWTKIGSTTEVTTSTTSTSAASLTTIDVGSSIVDASKIIYVRIRDKEGKRAGYFYGSDTFFMNYQKANNATSALTYGGRFIHRYSTSNTWATYTGGTTTGYGVYAYSITSAGVLNIYQRYSSSYSLTVNGTYTVEVYTLTFPDNVSPYSA